jgi:hypothetical protein
MASGILGSLRRAMGELLHSHCAQTTHEIQDSPIRQRIGSIASEGISALNNATRMTSNTLYLFPDTNLFVQCVPLEQINWSSLGCFDEIQILVSRPVQSEIDNQKNKGRERLGQKARATSSLFREAILDPENCKIVKKGKPLVRLLVKQELKPSAGLGEQLDYQERDDQLVGTAHAFLQLNDGADVRVLTHDTGPMASAKMIGVAFTPIPDEWLIPPESSEKEKKIKLLEKEIALLRKAEPDFRIECLDDKGEETDTLELDVTRYEPISERESSELIFSIMANFPIATQFCPLEPAEKAFQKFPSPIFEVEHVPPTDKEIDQYRLQHQEWLKQCKRQIREFHHILQRRDDKLLFKFMAINEGTRPGKDVLITIEAKGKFKILPEPDESTNVKNQPSEDIAFPAPPSVPRGVWKPRNIWANVSSSSFVNPFAVTPTPIPDLTLFRAPVIQPRDPNGFYYKPKQPSLPTSEFELECKQWRHGIAQIYFAGQIHEDKDEELLTGLIECRIHAENLSSVIAKRVVVKININRAPAYDAARIQVDRLIASLCR